MVPVVVKRDGEQAAYGTVAAARALAVVVVLALAGTLVASAWVQREQNVPGPQVVAGR